MCPKLYSGEVLLSKLPAPATFSPTRLLTHPWKVFEICTPAFVLFKQQLDKSDNYEPEG